MVLTGLAKLTNKTQVLISQMEGEDLLHQLFKSAVFLTFDPTADLNAELI